MNELEILQKDNNVRINEKRDAEIYALRESGKTFKEIGDIYGMSGSNVRLIVNNYVRERELRDAFGKYGKQLSNRTLNILRYRGITTAEQLLEIEPEKIYYFRGAGTFTVAEIIAWQRLMGKDVKSISIKDADYISKNDVIDIIKDAGVYDLVADKINALNTVKVKEKD